MSGTTKIRPPIIRAWTGDPVDVDLYAGGGGASEGKRRATMRSPDIAINHSPAAIAMHKANHPDCRHFIEDAFKVRPIDATQGRRCRFLWASPTCVHFSRASGARLSPDTIKIRGLAWSIVPWIIETRPDIIFVENVVEFLSWGPVCWQHSDDCPGRDKNPSAGVRSLAETSESSDEEVEDDCVKACPYGRPIKSRAGETFRAFEKRIRSFGYSFEVRVLKAWEYGAPTTRERAYIAMCADGKPFKFPKPTHTRDTWRTAAEIIDWTIPCPSVFGRKKPHVPATRRRLARGIRKFVLEAVKPFLMHLTHGDHHHLVAAHTVKFYGTSTGQRLDNPLDTVTGQGLKHGVVAASLLRYNGKSIGQCPRPPIVTLDARDRNAIVEAAAAEAAAAEWTDIVAAKAARVFKFLLAEGHDGPWMDHERQLVRIPGTHLAIYDIGMRMLVPRELFSANGFEQDYVIDLVGPRGKPLTKTEQVRMAGNVVCPDVAHALYRAALARPRKRQRPQQQLFFNPRESEFARHRSGLGGPKTAQRRAQVATHGKAA